MEFNLNLVKMGSGWIGIRIQNTAGRKKYENYLSPVLEGISEHVAHMRRSRSFKKKI